MEHLEQLQLLASREECSPELRGNRRRRGSGKPEWAPADRLWWSDGRGSGRRGSSLDLRPSPLTNYYILCLFHQRDTIPAEQALTLP